MKRPVVLFDRDCRFCTMWVERWKESAGDRMDFQPFQDAADIGVKIPRENLEAAIHYIDGEGRVYRGAEAVMELLSKISFSGRMLLWIYRNIPFAAPVSEFCYAAIAKHRSFFSWWTRLLCGPDLRKSKFAVAAWLYLRLLGLTYLIAFWSLWLQLPGLIGSRGILPFAAFFASIKSQIGAQAYYYCPSLLWLFPNDRALLLVAVAGMISSLALIAGIAPRLMLAASWVLYLSLTSAGQVFLGFQWDALLLEAGFLSFFLAPSGWWRGGRLMNPSWVGRLLLWWLLFRLMFCSGVVKLSAESLKHHEWHSLIALNYHYFTQPLPNRISWYMQQLPALFQKISVLGMFSVELVFSFFIFAPRRLRLMAFVALAGFQVVIFATGNYGFFNLLSFALCVLLLDDRIFEFLFRLHFQPETRRASAFAKSAAFVLFLVSLVPVAFSFRDNLPVPSPLVAVCQAAEPFRIVNGYGLFANMTTERKEIIVQGSENGFEWKTYEFFFKPGPLDRPPPFAAFYMPRLDWQMWFAALGGAENNQWFSQFLVRLLEGSPPVLKLVEKNPFEAKPPHYIRALRDDYRFTSLKQRNETGNWWTAEPDGIYFQEASLNR